MLSANALAAVEADVEASRLAEAASVMPELGPPPAAAADRIDSAQTAEALTTMAQAAGAALWAHNVERVQAGVLNDRPLYWHRLALNAELLAAAQALGASASQTAAAVAAFEHHSRGYAEVLEYARAGTKRVLMTGFDPFLLDASIQQMNPSGVAALALHGRVIDVEGTRFEVRSAVFPVRYDDFDEGIVERVIEGAYGQTPVDLVVTVSMGRDHFDLERFPGRRRSADAPDNRNRHGGGSETEPVIVPLGGKPIDGPEFVEFSLPAAAMLSAEGPYQVRDRRTVTTLDTTFDAPGLEALNGAIAVRGSGGGYLSNEISYRSIRLRNALGASVPTGHIHTPRITSDDPDTIARILAQLEGLLSRAVRAL